jgi:hypothetical protein
MRAMEVERNTVRSCACFMVDCMRTAGPSAIGEIPIEVAAPGAVRYDRFVTKLILVEGLPGSGKTTLAGAVATRLQDRGVRAGLYLEGNLDHPADFESVAYLSPQEDAALRERFADEGALLDRHAIRDGNDIFYRYRALRESEPGMSAGLLSALSQHEVYEQPAGTYRRLLLERWRRFAERAREQETVYVFECCLLQNPLTMMLGRHSEPVEEAKRFVRELSGTVTTLQPRLIYLKPENVRERLERVARSRPPEWLEFVIAYHTQQGHGKLRGWQGLDGLIEFYKMRQEIEIELLGQLDLLHTIIEHRGWERDHDRAFEFVMEGLA